MLRLVVDKVQSLKSFTENNCAQAGFYYHVLLKNKDIKINGKRVGADISVREGDVVEYYLTPKQAEKPAFYPVFEDENILVVDKESGVNAEAVFAALARAGEVYFIHRLDRNTRGLMIFAKNQESERTLLSAFKNRQVEKRYHALCLGRPSKENAVLTAYLKKNAEKALVAVYASPVSDGEKIITEYRTVESRGELTKLEVTLHTGKTHQIRAHLAHIGNPVVGDMKYGDTARNKALGATRQVLVAKYLSLRCEGKLGYLKGVEWISRFEANL